MGEVISICIPVNNEQATIERTLLSIELQKLPKSKELEVLVCANGCTDRTEDIVAEMSRKYPNITLYSEKKPSKPLAWNLLMAKSAGEKVVFTDGDVLFGREAIINLTQRLDETGKALIAGRGIPYLQDETPVQRKFVSVMTSSKDDLDARGHITGQLYAISKTKINQALVKNNILEMPEKLIAEDFWLGCLVGPENWEFLPSATFHYRHSSWKDFYKINSRFLRARQQLIEGTGLVGEISFGNPSRYYLDKLLSEPRLRQKAKMISRFFVRRAYSLASSLCFERVQEKDNTYWERAESTKRPIPIEAIYGS